MLIFSNQTIPTLFTNSCFTHTKPTTYRCILSTFVAFPNTGKKFFQELQFPMCREIRKNLFPFLCFPVTKHSLRTVHKYNYISFWQLNCLMVMVVLSASGLVGPQDFAFVIFSTIYLFFLSKFAFPKLTDPMEEPPVFNPESYLVRLGPLFGGIIGIAIPIAYIFEGFIEEDKEGIRAAAPHVFLLASQVFMDGVAFSDRMLTPIRVFVPVFYNSKRIFTLVDWVEREFSKADDQEFGGSASERRLFLGRVLAIVNLVFWTYDLFFFMLPVYLPRAFRKYYAAAKTD